MFTVKSITADFVKKHKTLVAISFASGLIGSLLNVFIPLSIGKFYELVLHTNSAKGKLFEAVGIEIQSTRSFLYFFIAIILARSVLLFIQKYATGIINETFSKNLRELLFSRQMGQSLTDFQSKPAGQYLLRYSGDMTSIQKYIGAGVIGFTSDVFFMITAFFVLFLMNISLTLLIVAGIGTGAVVYFLLGRLVKPVAAERRNQKSGLLHFASSRLFSFFTVKAFNRETPEVNAFNKRSEKLFASGKSYQALSALNESFLPLLFFGVMALVLYAIHDDAVQHRLLLSKSNVVSYILMVLYMQSPFKRILKVNTVWQNASISFSKLISILNIAIEKREADAMKDKPKATIAMQNVSFGYTDKQPVINNFSFTFFPGNMYVIHGSQGSGKSTLLKLLLNIYHPSNGNIFLDQCNYNKLSPFFIRKQMTLVSDEAPLLGSTVFKAISYSGRESQEEKTNKILSQLDFALSDELKNPDFILDNNASNISKGQRTVLGFARALNSGKKILLLDEPFVNLDDRTTDGIVQLLNSLKSKKTIIIAAHYIPQLLDVDQVIELNSTNTIEYENS